MKQTKKIIFLMLIFCGGLMYGQTVSGKVLDNSLPLPGVNVLVKGSQNGVVTDFDGRYTINNVDKDAVLVFSYIGYRTQQVAVNSRSQIDVALLEDTSQLDEVVVIGYGTQKKSQLTTAISTVKAQEISEIPVADISQALQGRAAGVNVVNSGTPGGRTLVRIRGLGTFGNGDPLFVVDGVFTSSINNISPASIETIDILKDAAATAIYGSRGSNGVIIITTKKGKSGKASFSFNTSSGFRQNNERYDVLNTNQYVQFLREIATQPTDGAISNIIAADPTFDGGGVSTDWQDALFRSAPMTSFDFTASGGSEKSNFSFGLSSFDQEGIYVDTGFDRKTINLNTEFKLTDKIKVGQTLSVGYTETVAPEQFGGRELLGTAISAQPFIPLNRSDFFSDVVIGGDVRNTRSIVDVYQTNDNLQRRTAMVGSAYIEIDLLEGLSFRSQFGLDANFQSQDNISRAFGPAGGISQSFTNISKQRQNFSSQIFTNTLNYSKSFGTHNFGLTLVSENQESKFEIVNTSLQTTIQGVPEINNGVASSQTSPDKLVSYLGRFNYDYDGKYLLQASVRRDKSAKFAPGNQVGWFPAASIGWVASKESFLDDTAINNLKFRASYGVTGNNSTGTLNAFQSTLSPNFNYPINGVVQPGITPFGANNADLQWEEATKVNFGFDLGLWQNKLTFSAEYFENSSDGLIVLLPTPLSAGIPAGNVASNVGDVSVDGIELTLGINDYEGDFKWNVWANVSTANSVVNQLGNGVEQINLSTFNPPFSETLSRLAPGEPLYHFFGFEFEGVYATDQEIIDHLGADNLDSGSGQVFQPRAGDARYRDISGPDGVPDGDITEADRVVIGNPNPDFTYAISFRAEYKDFDISILGRGVQGVDAINGNLWFLQGQEGIANYGTEVLRRWQNPGDITDVPRFRLEGNNPNNRISTRYISDGSYFRLKNVVLGYSLPKKVLNNAFNGLIKKTRFYFQAENLVTLTRYAGLDPEIQPSYGGAGIVGLGIDRGKAPQPQTYLLGLQIEF